MTPSSPSPDESLHRPPDPAPDPHARPARLARNALLLSVAAIALPIAIAIPSRSSDSSPAGFLFVLGIGLGTWGLVLGASVLIRFRRPRRIRTILASVFAILLGLIAWPCALFVAFIAAGGAGAPGRPLRVAGVRILPRVRRARRPVRRVAPGPHEPDPTLVSQATRARLAKLWLADARAEHASVTAFERLAADLTAAGAPTHLVEWARRAALDEVGHATMCFAVASAYAGRELGASPAPFVPPWRGRAASRDALIQRLAMESLLDGGIEEGIAAKSARVGASHAVDPAIAKVLATIAQEEARHAQLGYAIVRWAVRERPSVLPELLAAMKRASERGSHPLADQDDLLSSGRVGAGPLEALSRDAREEARDLLEKLSGRSDSCRM